MREAMNSQSVDSRFVESVKLDFWVAAGDVVFGRTEYAPVTSTYMGRVPEVVDAVKQVLDGSNLDLSLRSGLNEAGQWEVGLTPRRDLDFRFGESVYSERSLWQNSR